MPSIFAGLDSSMVVRDPFPHIYVEGLLDDDLCRRLAEEIPPPDKYTRGRIFSDDEKFYRPGTELIADPDVSETWKRFISENIGVNAFLDFYRIFEEEIAREFPEVAVRLGKTDSLRVGVRSPRTRDRIADNEYDVLMEAQHVYFMPVREGRTERGPHLKTPEKIFGSFLCLRRDEDDSTGGDFVLHSVAQGARLGARNQIDPGDVSPARVIPRRRNVYIGFLNTRRAVTEMTPRSPSPHSSVYLNLLVGLSQKVWRQSIVSPFNWSWRRWQPLESTSCQTVPHSHHVSRPRSS
jgi:hypothetical protein